MTFESTVTLQLEFFFFGWISLYFYIFVPFNFENCFVKYLLVKHRGVFLVEREDIEEIKRHRKSFLYLLGKIAQRSDAKKE